MGQETSSLCENRRIDFWPHAIYILPQKSRFQDRRPRYLHYAVPIPRKWLLSNQVGSVLCSHGSTIAMSASDGKMIQLPQYGIGAWCISAAPHPTTEHAIHSPFRGLH